MIESEKETRKSSRIFVAYEELLTDWEGLISRVQQSFKFSWPSTPKVAGPEIKAFLDESMRHNRATKDSLIKEKNFSNWVRDAYFAVTDNIGGGNTALIKAMDAIEAKLKEGTILYESEMTNILEKERSNRAKLHERKQQLDDINNRLMEISQNNANYLSDIDHLKISNNESDEYIQQLNTEMLVLEKQVSKLTKSIHDRDKQANNLMILIKEKDDHIQQLDTEILASEGQVSKLKISLKERDKQFKYLLILAKKKEKHIQQFNTEMLSLEKQVSKLTKSIEDRDNQVNNFKILIKEKDIHIQQLNVESKELNNEISHKNKEIKNMDSQSAQQDKFISELTARLNQQGENINNFTTRLSQRDKTVNDMTTRLTEQNEVINNLKSDLEDRDESEKKLTTLLASKDIEILDLKNQNAQKVVEIVDLSNQLSLQNEDNINLMSQVAELRQSTSWKMTAPIRWCSITARKSVRQASKVYMFIFRKFFSNLVISSYRKRQIQNWAFTKIPFLFRHTLAYNQQALDLIALKPVGNKWKHTKKLKHKYNISVIIPTYNRAHILKELLGSWRNVAEVTKYSYEIIFSDDGSTDETVNILKGAKDLPLKILANTHGGAAKARNAAIAAAEGEKILIFGDDIFPNQYILNQHYEKLHELEITDAVLGECKWHSELKVNHLMDHITEIGCEQFSFKFFQKYNFTDFRHFYTCNISIDREFLLSEKKIFDESFYKVNFEDIELGYRLAKKGMKVYYYPDAIAQHFHPYADVEKFCIRQEQAGEMAIIFKKLHKEIEPVVDIEFITSKWSKYIQYNNEVIDVFDIYKELIAFCQFIENHNETRHSNLSENLSVVYSKLFRFAYEKGICQQKLDTQKEFLNRVFLNEFFTKQLTIALCNLNEDCKVANFNNLLNFMEIVTSEKILLTIEAKDQKHLNDLVDHYGALQNYIRYRFKSEIVYDGFLYRPQKGFFLSENSLKQILLFLQKYPKIDVVILSFGLFDLPKIGLIDSIKNSLITRGNCKKDNSINLKNAAKGKVIRIFETTGAYKVDIFSLVSTRLGHFDDYGFFSHKKLDTNSIQNSTFQFEIADSNNKPLVFIFPTFLAVGGVEKNTIEIIRHLKTKYEFVVVNFERLNQKLGSLHHQFISSCKGVYDLTELSTHDDILGYLKVLKEVYNPELIWICNGSPWLANNTSAIREIFYKSAIVDQQVYDVKEGWINIFDDASVLSFDRFIAINSKIKNVFIEEKGIDKSKIDLIYHVVQSERFDKARYTENKEILAKNYAISLKKKNFVFVGRIADQKRPLLFLNMVKQLKQIYKNYNFIMVGDGPFSFKVQDFIINNDLKTLHRIKFIENLAELYAVVDGIIITSKYEGLPIAMLEAMCMGLPVFATNVGDIDIVIEEYKSGMVVPVNSTSEELVEKFLIFDKNLQLYRDHALKSSDSIRKRFSGETVSAIYDSCFRKAVKDKNDQCRNAKL